MTCNVRLPGLGGGEGHGSPKYASLFEQYPGQQTPDKTSCELEMGREPKQMPKKLTTSIVSPVEFLDTSLGFRIHESKPILIDLLRKLRALFRAVLIIARTWSVKVSGLYVTTQTCIVAKRELSRAHKRPLHFRPYDDPPPNDDGSAPSIQICFNKSKDIGRPSRSNALDSRKTARSYFYLPLLRQFYNTAKPLRCHRRRVPG